MVALNAPQPNIYHLVSDRFPGPPKPLVEKKPVMLLPSILPLKLFEPANFDGVSIF